MDDEMMAGNEARQGRVLQSTVGCVVELTGIEGKVFPLLQLTRSRYLASISGTGTLTLQYPFVQTPKIKGPLDWEA